jgi:hypothetical protein
MTPKEAAELEDAVKKREWILAPSRTPRELLEFLVVSRQQLGWRSGDLIESALAVRISEISDAASLRLERHTVKLVHLTYVLAALTLGLFIIEIAHYVRPPIGRDEIGIHQMTPNTALEPTATAP